MCEVINVLLIGECRQKEAKKIIRARYLWLALFFGRWLRQHFGVEGERPESEDQPGDYYPDSEDRWWGPGDGEESSPKHMVWFLVGICVCVRQRERQRDCSLPVLMDGGTVTWGRTWDTEQDTEFSLGHVKSKVPKGFPGDDWWVF